MARVVAFGRASVPALRAPFRVDCCASNCFQESALGTTYRIWAWGIGESMREREATFCLVRE